MRVRFSPLAPGYKKKSIYALIFYDRPYEKDHVVELLAPEQKRKSIHTLYFFGRLYEKDHVVGLLTPDSKEKEYLYSFYLESPA